MDPENQDSEKLGTWKAWNLKNLDPKKLVLWRPELWKTWTLQNLDPGKRGNQLDIEKWLEDHIIRRPQKNLLTLKIC